MTDPQPPEQPSVFATRDQDEMLNRIGDTADDDLGSSFFDNSIQDVEDAAVRMFDIGIKTITEDPAAVRAAFAVGASASGATPVPGAAASAATSPIEPGADGRFSDPAVRAAFILGGPAALRS
jgi:hypothetical protein